jgi:purine/pyrimidine-nucleoside phosphorylase
MSEFKNVTVVREANIYFDGKVTSRTVLFPDGSKKTLGVMLPGEFEFGTGDKELMEIFSGELDVLLPGDATWKSIKGGQSFEVAPNSKFKLKVKKLADYCCSFIKG